MTIDERTLVATGRATLPQERSEHIEIAKGTVIGRYVVVREVGRGAMGIVFAAYDPKLDRRVALKVLLGDPDADQNLDGLLAEAQALARINHRNVVAVHDAGEFHGRVFIAMEFVEGITLTRWQIGKSPKAILTAYRQAARGLEAAHRAEVIHRDFKPDNVMAAEDGRVLVTDFGLAQAQAVESDDDPSASSSQALTLNKHAGTPAYMSPEQYHRRPLTPATDQFSFCVALYEALAGRRPFKASSVAKLALAITAGKVQLRGVPNIPAWLAAILRRGFSRNPAERYASMEELAKDIDSGMARRRRISLGAAGVAGVAAIGLVVASNDPAAPCKDARDRISEVWDAPRANSIREAFLATGHIDAGNIASLATESLDRYVEEWSEESDKACGSWRKTADPDLLQARRRCLDAQLGHLEGVVEVLSESGNAPLSLALVASSDLPNPLECGELESLEQVQVIDSNEVLSAQVLLARARPLRIAGEYERASDLLDEAIAALGDREAFRVRAQVAAERSLVANRAGDLERSKVLIGQGVELAARAGDDQLSADLWLTRVDHLSGASETDLALRRQLLDVADYLVLRAGNAPVQRARLLGIRASFLLEQGDFDGAIEQLNDALELAEGSRMAASNLASFYGYLGFANFRKGDLGQAKAFQRRAIEILESGFGEFAPEVLGQHTNLAGYCLTASDRKCAARHYGIVAERLEALGDEVSLNRAQRLADLGQYEYFEGNMERAMSLTSTSLETFEKLGMERSYHARTAHTIAFRTMRNDDRWEDALERAQLLSEIDRTHLSAEHPEAQTSTLLVGEALVGLGRYDSALERFELVHDMRVRSYGTEHREVAYTFAKRAEALEKLERHREALELVLEAAAIYDKVDARVELAAQTDFSIARLRWKLDDDREAAVELARNAHRVLQKVGGRYDEADDEVMEWLKERGYTATPEVE